MWKLTDSLFLALAFNFADSFMNIEITFMAFAKYKIREFPRLKRRSNSILSLGINKINHFIIFRIASMGFMCAVNLSQSVKVKA